MDQALLIVEATENLRHHVTLWRAAHSGALTPPPVVVAAEYLLKALEGKEN